MKPKKYSIESLISLIEQHSDFEWRGYTWWKISQPELSEGLEPPIPVPTLQRMLRDPRIVTRNVLLEDNTCLNGKRKQFLIRVGKPDPDQIYEEIGGTLAWLFDKQLKKYAAAELSKPIDEPDHAKIRVRHSPAEYGMCVGLAETWSKAGYDPVLVFKHVLSNWDTFMAYYDAWGIENEIKTGEQHQKYFLKFVSIKTIRAYDAAPALELYRDHIQNMGKKYH